MLFFLIYYNYLLFIILYLIVVVYNYTLIIKLEDEFYKDYIYRIDKKFV